MNLSPLSFRFLLLLCTSAIFFGPLTGPALAQNGYTWRSVNISGAGAMVTGVVAHPSEAGLVYIRTDVGGAFRWNPANSRWIPLSDGFAFEQRAHFSCESLALDPTNTNTVYYSGGFKVDKTPGAIFKSTNRGATWTKLSPGLTKPMGGNMDRRWAGERLAVNPANPAILLYGTRTDGLWRSTDTGQNWAKVAGIPTAADIYGVQCVAFDSSTPGRVVVAVSGSGVYLSTNHGASFTSIGGGTSPMRMAVAPNGTLWYTHRTGVAKYAASAWTNYTPGLSSGTDVYSSLAVNPANSSEVLVGRKEQGSLVFQIYRSTDAGLSWSQVNYTISTNVPWFLSPLAKFRASALAYDPFNTNSVWADHWRTDNIGATNPNWVMQTEGHEEDVVGTLVAPPSGPYELLSGSFDNDGFAMNNGLDTYPTKPLGISGSWNGHTWGMAYQEGNPSKLIRIGAQKFNGGVVNVAKSADGGASWQRMAAFPANLFPINCAISATNANNMVVICNPTYSGDATGATWTNPQPATQPWRYTMDGGATWSVIGGLPAPRDDNGPWSRRIALAADRVNGSKFYYYHPDIAAGVGQIYRSTDGGATFSPVNVTPLPAKSWHQLKTRPGVEGELWLCVDNDNHDYQSFNRQPAVEGLYRSTDGGATWSKFSGVSRAFSFGFGLPAGAGPHAVFLYGRVNGAIEDGLYRTMDLGLYWSKISGPVNQLGDLPTAIEGSRQTYGRVFVGTGGRGIFYGTYNSPYTSVTLPATVEMENYDNGGEGFAYHDGTPGNTSGVYRNDDVDVGPTAGASSYKVGYMNAGEWLKYTVVSNNARNYTVTLRVATTAVGRTLHLENEAGVNLTGSIIVPTSGGWTTWTTVQGTVFLPAGRQVLKFVTDSGGFDINYMTFQ